MRTLGRAVLGLALVAMIVGCSPALTPAAVLTPAPTPASPLPAVAGRISFSLPGGDAYGPQAAAIDETGRAVVLCYESEAAGSSALVSIDPASGQRGPVWRLPGVSLGPLAAHGGYAYAAYQDAQYRSRLATVELETGRIVADVPTEFVYSGDALAAGPAGRLYVPLADRLEVRDGASLAVVRTLPYDSTSPERALATDLARDRLYLAVGTRLRAYRLPDLTPLWEAAGLAGRLRLTVDQAGARLYARCEAYEGSDFVVRLLAFDAASGQALAPVSAPTEGSGWQLVAADSAAGRLVFADSRNMDMRLWLADLTGRPTGAAADLPGWAAGYAAAGGRLLLPLPGEHLVRILSLADLRPLADVPTGIEIRYVVADPAHERAYVNDSAGRVHAVDTRSYTRQASVAAGRGQLVLDAPNSLLFVSREARGSEVAALSTAPLTVTATITGGYKVAVDSGGRRAFVGWTEPRNPTPGEVQVWDTRTFQRTGAIPHRGEPAYNPLRDEVYLQDYSAYVADGKSLAVTGELTPDIGQTPPGLLRAEARSCNGCQQVRDITVDAAQDVIAVSLETSATGGGPGSLLQPRLFSATTREPATHTATALSRCCGSTAPFIIPPDGGLVYEAQRYRRYVAYNAALAYPAGAATPSAWRDGLPLDLYLPGRQVGLGAQQGRLLAFSTATWQPLGWLPAYCIGEIDLQGRRLYAWERAQLTVLTFDGGQGLASEPPEPLSEGATGGQGVQEIVLSPDFQHDRTLFAITDGQPLRSTDAGGSWSLLRGGLPPRAPGIIPRLSLAISPAYAQDRTLFIAGMAGEPVGYGVWRSTDGGDSWAPVWSGLEHLRVERVIASPRYAEDHTLLAYAQYQEFWRAESGTSLFRSADGGATWQRLATRPNIGTPPPLPQPEELLPCPAAPVQFKVSEQGDAVLRSADGGQTWQTALRRADPGWRPLAVARSPLFERDRQVWVLFEDLLYRSTDGGASWEVATDQYLVRANLEEHFTALAVGRGGDGRVLVLVGDYSGTILPLDPQQVHWAPES